jgi:hypothetical protein
VAAELPPCAYNQCQMQKTKKKRRRYLSAYKTFEIYKNRYLSACKAEILQFFVALIFAFSARLSHQ